MTKIIAAIIDKIQPFSRSSNAITIGVRGHHVTLWSRAASSIGWLEAWRYDWGCSASICVWGWQATAETRLFPMPKGSKKVWGFKHDFGDWAYHTQSPRFRGYTLRQRATIRIVTWLMGQPGVWEAVAQTASESGAFCRVIEQAVQHHADQASITVDQIEDLDEYLSKNRSVDVDDVEGFEDAVRDALRDSDLVDGLVEEACDRIADKLSGR